MRTHIRFRKSLDAYPQGSAHWLPDELAEMYVKAGVAEVVDVVPVKTVAPVAVASITAPEKETSPVKPDDKPDTTKRKKS